MYTIIISTYSHITKAIMGHDLTSFARTYCSYQMFFFAHLFWKGASVPCRLRMVDHLGLMLRRSSEGPTLRSHEQETWAHRSDRHGRAMRPTPTIRGQVGTNHAFSQRDQC